MLSTRCKLGPDSKQVCENWVYIIIHEPLEALALQPVLIQGTIAARDEPFRASFSPKQLLFKSLSPRSSRSRCQYKPHPLARPEVVVNTNGFESAH